MTDKAALIAQTETFVKERLAQDSSGHDWWHIHRVRQTALYICQHEANVDYFVVELATLLHDIADWKFTGDTKAGATAAKVWLDSIHVDESVSGHVCEIIERLSYKGGFEKRPMATIEGKIVQDADRLDALGPVGIARTFAYGGAKGRVMYDPTLKAQNHDDFESFRQAEGTTINHFYEKLLLLKDTLNTRAGREIGAKLHVYLESYLAAFYAQWDGDFDKIEHFIEPTSLL